jgi:hypothetical protein
MQNKKLLLVIGVLILLAGSAAFIAGRMLNRGVGPLGLFAGEGDGISILRAEELPKTSPEEEGIFVGRQDNIILVESDQSGGGGVSDGPVGMGGGPQVEVVVTNETILYHDTTQPPSHRPSGDDPRVLQQTVEEGTLDDLSNSQSLVMVWGRKSGDRIIAEVLVYSNPTYLQKP